MVLPCLRGSPAWAGRTVDGSPRWAPAVSRAEHRGVLSMCGRCSRRRMRRWPHASPSAPRATPRLGSSLRIFEISESLRLVGAALDALPDGPLTVALPQVSGEGIGCAESIRGDVWHWLRLDHGQIAAVFTRDPGWALWPLAELVLENASAGDAGLIRASLALPASGMDL